MFFHLLTLYFRECLGEAHAPCGCSQWHQWQQKISEVKPEELRASCVETEDAANCLWLVTNSKPCPNCKSPIQKNEGCNHMKCSKVFIAFCCSSLNALKYLIFRYYNSAFYWRIMFLLKKLWLNVIVSVLSAHVDYNRNNVKNAGDKSDQHYHMFKSSEIWCAIGRIVPKIS